MPSLGNVATTVSLTGLISATNDMPIGVEGDGGRVSAVMVEPGDRVKRGQVLARLNPLTAESQVHSAEASYEELKAAAASSQAEYARAERARDSFSVEEFERRRTNALTAEAKAKAAGAQLAEARTRWQRMTVVAPSDGIVLTRAAEIGQMPRRLAAVVPRRATARSDTRRGGRAGHAAYQGRSGRDGAARRRGNPLPAGVADQCHHRWGHPAGTVRIAAHEDRICGPALSRADIRRTPWSA